MGRIPSTHAIGEGFNWNNKQLPSACPVKTSHDRSLQERTGIDLSEIRAYKLGKRRWSYNQVELILCNELDEEQLSVTQAFYSGTVPGELGESALMYNVHLSNGQTLLFELYLVYDSPKMLSTTDGVQVEWYACNVLKRMF